MDEIKARLKKYTSIKREALLTAAADELLPTADLITISKEIIVAERTDQEEMGDYLALMILHLRANEDTLNQSIALLASEDAVDRELGCRILREFPRLDDAPTRFSATIVHAMSQLIETEKEEQVLLSALSTIGWQCHETGHQLLLKMSADPRDAIRFTIADNLLTLFKNGRKVTQDYAEAFLRFTSDPDEDIRRSVFYDIAEHTEIFSDFKEVFLEAARQAQNDPSPDVQKEALKALNSLQS